MKKKKKLIILAAIILLVFIGWKVLNIYVNHQFMKAIFPHTQVVFETSMEPVDIYVGDVHYRVPKAYLYWPAHMNGGKLKNFSMRANIDEGMIPWTVSQNYKNRLKEGMIDVDVHNRTTKDYIEKFLQQEIERMLSSQKRSFPERYSEVDKGIYNTIFHRYDELGPIGNTNKQGLGSMAYLVPIVKTKKPFLIKCWLPINPHHFCTVHTFNAEEIMYEFQIPSPLIEEFVEWDKKVQNLITRLIAKE